MGGGDGGRSGTTAAHYLLERLTVHQPQAVSPGPSTQVTTGSLRQIQRDRMVWAQHLAAALQAVLTQCAGRLCLAQLGQGDGEGARCHQGDYLVWAQHL